MISRFDYLSPVSRSVFVGALIGALALFLLVVAIPESEFLVNDELYGLELFSKVSDFYHVDSNPDVIMFGSSLVLGPSIACDNSILRVDKGKRQSYTYAKSVYFERLLKQRTRAKPTIYNLALPGAMMSDQCQLFEQALSIGKKPALVIFGLGPRDFIANDMSKPASTPIGIELDRFKVEQSNELTPTRVYEKLSLAATRLTESLQHKSSGAKSILSTRVTAMLPSIHPMERGEHKEALKTQRAADREKDRRAKQTAKQHDYYQWVYNPYQPSIFDLQEPYLSRALKVARENSVAVLIVNMPLSRANKAQLNPEANARYQKMLKQVTSDFSVAFLDFGSNSEKFFSEDEFEDGVHLGLVGSRRFLQAISEMMTDDPRLAKALSYDPLNKIQ